MATSNGEFARYEEYCKDSKLSKIIGDKPFRLAFSEFKNTSVYSDTEAGLGLKRYFATKFYTSNLVSGGEIQIPMSGFLLKMLKEPKNINHSATIFTNFLRRRSLYNNERPAE